MVIDTRKIVFKQVVYIMLYGYRYKEDSIKQVLYIMLYGYRYKEDSI